MAIKHGFTSLVTDIGGPTYIQPTHWNAPHNTPPFRIFDFDPGAAPASFGIPSTAGPTAMEFPAGDNAAFNRGRVDFTNIDNIYLAAGLASIQNTGGVAGGSVALRLQYMPSGFPGSWYSFDATGGSAPFISCATANNASIYLASTNGLMQSATVAVSAAAKALPQPLTIRVAGYGGNGSALNLCKIIGWAF